MFVLGIFNDLLRRRVNPVSLGRDQRRDEHILVQTGQRKISEAAGGAGEEPSKSEGIGLSKEGSRRKRQCARELGRGEQ